MTVLRRTSIKWAILLLALLALLTIALTAILQSARFKDWLLAEISLRSGFAVRADSLGFRPPLTLIANAAEVTKPGQFHFTTVRLGARVNLWSRTVDELLIEQPVLSINIDGLAKSPTAGSTAMVLRQLIVQNGTLALKRGEHTVMDLAKINLRAHDLDLAAQSGITLAADVPQLNGTAELRVTGQPRDFDARIILRPKPARSIWREPKPTNELLSLRLKLRAPEQQPISAVIDSQFHAIEFAGNKLTGSLAAEASIDPNLTMATFTGKVAIADFAESFRALPIKLSNGAVAVSLAGSYAVSQQILVLKSLQLSSPFGRGVGAVQVVFGAEPTITAAKIVVRDVPLTILKANLPAPMNQWSYQGLGQLTVDAQGPWRALAVKGVVQCDSLQLRGDPIAVANLALTAPFEWTGPSLRFTETRWRATKVAYAPKERWQGAVENLQVVSSFDYRADQPVKVYGSVEATGAQFHSPDSTKVGENISLQGPFELTVNRQKQTTRIAGKLSAASGELLWGKFFGDFKSQKPVLDLDVDYVRGADRLDCRRCDWHLAQVGRVEVAGAIERVTEAPVLHLQASSGNFSPSGFFEFFLRETFNRQYPALDKLAVAGQIAFQLRVDGKLDGLSASGDLSLAGGELRAKSNGWQIGPIALKLPLRIHLTESRSEPSAAPPTGTLTIERIRFADQTIAPIATTISLANNALRLHQPIRFGLFGGELVISKLFWPDLLNEPKRVSFSADTKRLKLEELTQTMNWPRFSGTLTGSIPEVHAAASLLRTRGEIHAELFGGRIRMSKLEIDNPFSSLASFKLDAKLQDIELEQLTKTFAFGRISGILEGSIDDLVLTDGQPSELSADLHSVDRGGEQRISVEALNKITVLSSGEDAGALYGGLAAFFDSFRYSKLGFKATLKNDRLTLRGVESRNDQEMLVVGSFLPPTVNIVSHTQNIAFSELLRRLEQINKTGKPNVQ